MAKAKRNSDMSYGWLVIQPVVFLFLSIFVFRDDVRFFYLLSAILLIDLAVLSRKLDSFKKLALTLTALASIGLSSAVILTVEKIELLKNPEHVTSCSFSPIVACSPVIGSDQASAIDQIPNPIFGIFGFACVLTAGMSMLAGAQKLSKYWWYTLLAGIVFGTGFCIWLINAGLYQIGALCLYCMAVWLVTFTLFWLVLSELSRQKLLGFPQKLNDFVVKNRDTLITATVGLVLVLVYFRWSDYWNSLL